MGQITLKHILFGGISLQIPEVWNTITESYTEPDGRECSMIEITAEEGDPRSIIISYGPMPEGSDALMEAGGTYEGIIGEIGPEPEEDQSANTISWEQQDLGLKFLQKTILHAILFVQRLALRLNERPALDANCSLS